MTSVGSTILEFNLPIIQISQNCNVSTQSNIIILCHTILYYTILYYVK